MRRATCSCGQLVVTCEGDPVRASICHCLACQQRTGSVFGVQARYEKSKILGIEGRSQSWIRVGDAGGEATFHFCPTCGATVYFEIDKLPDFVVVPVGAFADPHFVTPSVSIYEARKHAWVELPKEIQHID